MLSDDLIVLKVAKMQHRKTCAWSSVDSITRCCSENGRALTLNSLDEWWKWSLGVLA